MLAWLTLIAACFSAGALVALAMELGKIQGQLDNIRRRQLHQIGVEYGLEALGRAIKEEE